MLPPAGAPRATGHGVGVLLGLLALMSALAVVYMRAMPPFEAPDAGGHFGYIAYLRDHPGVPTLDFDTAGASHELIQQPPLYYALSAMVIGRRPLTPTLALYVVNPLYGSHGYRVTATPPVDPGGAMVPLRLAALVSLVGGLLTVVATWLLARTLWPSHPELSILAAAAVGLNPQLLAASSTITNDTWAAATFAWTVWAGVHASRRGTRPRAWLAVGFFAALAALAKYGNLTVLVLLAGLWLVYGRRQGTRAALAAALGFGAVLAALAGWWFATEYVRYGQPVPLERILALVPGLARDHPARLGHVLREAAWLPHSYWGVFGHGAVAPEAYFALVWALMLAACAGLVRHVVRAARSGRGARDGGVVLGLLAWFTVVLAGLLDWIRLVTSANQGRLLFPAAPAVGLLLALGWSGLVPARRRGAALGAFVTALVALAIWGACVVDRAFALPEPIAAPVSAGRPIVADFDGGMRLVGVDLPNGASVVGGGQLPVTLYFTARWEIGGFFPMFLHLTDSDDRRFAGFDGVNAGGRHPTRQWVPGATFADPYVLEVARVSTDTLAALSVGFYDHVTKVRRAARDGSDRPIGDRVVIGPVRIQREPPGPPFAGTPTAEWEGGIVLVSAAVDTAEGSPRAIRAEWQARAPIRRDYTVFAQLLDGDGHLLAQVDQQPQGGRWPTSTWVPGYAVRDVYRFDRAAPVWDELIIGFYDQQGARLALVGPTGAPGDHLVLRRAR
jgi:hypothetical protein